MAPTRAEIRSLLAFYNVLPPNSMTQCRIGEAARAIRVGLELELGPEDRALARRNYQGGKLTVRTFPKTFAMATKWYRDNPDTFAQVFGTETEFRLRHEEFVVPTGGSASHQGLVVPFSGTAHRLGTDLDAME